MRSLPINMQKHGFIMSRILVSIFQDAELASVLAFKGGTSLMFFHELPRFSTDLDFNLLDDTKTELVFQRIKTILSRYGTIADEANKFYDPILVLDYGKGERKLKVEASRRHYDNHYEIRSFAGTDIRVMTMPDMFAHKLCALGERTTPRDVFDVWFFLVNNTEINENIIQLRTGQTLREYTQSCARHVRQLSEKELMQGLGEVLDAKQKTFVRKSLIQETAAQLEMFSAFPLVSMQPKTARMQLILEHEDLCRQLVNADIDLSTLSEQKIQRLLGGETLELCTKHEQNILFRFS